MKQQILKESLLALYADLPEMVELIYQIDFDKLNHKFYSELFLRIPEEKFNKINDYLRSDEVMQYNEAIQSATLACTTSLTDVIGFLVAEREGGIQ